MSNLFTDPFGLQLMKVRTMSKCRSSSNILTESQCNKPKKEEESASEEDSKPTQEVYYYYPNHCSYPAFQPYYPTVAPTMVMMQQQSVVYHLPQPYYYVAPHLVAPEPSKTHQCVACSSEKKCKACEKEESKKIKKVIKPNWCNPRT